MKKIFALLFTLAAPTLSAHAQGPTIDQKPQPGNTGAYAFAFIDPAADASIGDQIIIDLRVDAGEDNLGTVQGSMVRLKIPFAKWVEIEANAVTDNWQISEEVRKRYNLNGTSASRFDGDLNFKTKIRILTETDTRPAIGFQVTAKTAAGDFLGGHRYTDSAGYEFSILGAKDIVNNDSDDVIIKKIRILTELAFIAWDTNIGQQNDSLKASAAVQLEARNGLKMKLSFLGYYGWQDPRVDAVSSVQVQVSKKISPHWEVYGQANVGLSSAATPLLIGAGVRYNIDGPKKKKRKHRQVIDDAYSPN